MQSNQETNRIDDNINMNSQMNNMIQQYKKQINELTGSPILKLFFKFNFS